MLDDMFCYTCKQIWSTSPIINLFNYRKNYPSSGMFPREKIPFKGESAGQEIIISGTETTNNILRGEKRNHEISCTKQTNFTCKCMVHCHNVKTYITFIKRNH